MPALQRLGLLFAAAVSLMAALAILLASGLPQRHQTPIAPEINAFAPDFVRPALSGHTIRLSDLRGEPVIVNFWATWCGPCTVEMPVLQSVFDEHRANGLHVLAVNMGESASTIGEWQAKHEFTYALLMDEDQTVAARYRLRGQPSTYVISPEGVITAIYFGPVTEAALTAALGY